MSVGEVGDGCQRAIDMMREGIERTTAARDKYSTAKSTLTEVLTEQSSRYGAVVGPYDKIDGTLKESISGALAAIEILQEYLAFLLGAAGTPSDTAPASDQSLGGASESEQRSAGSATDRGTADVSGFTRPSLTPDPERLPGGAVSKVRDARTEGDGIRRENTAAIVLARGGYDVVQNPPPKPNGREPDYLIEGRYWDCLSPRTANGGQIRKRMSEKIRKDQADRIILNLDREDGESVADIDDIRQSLERRPITGLKEIKIIHNQQVIDFYPW